MQKVKLMKKRILLSLIITALPFLVALGLLLGSRYPAHYKIAFSFIFCVLFSTVMGWYAGRVESSLQRSPEHG